MSLTIRARLTLLYFLVLGASFVVFFWICDLGFRRSIEITVNDESLNDLETVQRVIQRSVPRGIEHVQKELSELSDLWANGAIFQVGSSNGEWIFRAPRFLSDQTQLPPVAGETTFLTKNLKSFQYRIARRRFQIEGRTFDIDTAVPTEPFDQALDRFRIIEQEFLPLLALFASLLGYWLSGRGLAPVNRIIESAESIGVRNLHHRLEVPKAKDELRRLSETLNAMLERIDSFVKRITQFTADASHDLRTPLSLIRTNAELALRRPRSESEYKAAFSRILETTDETMQLIDHLLTIARADAGANQLRFEVIPIQPILKRIAEHGRILAAAKGLYWSEEIPPKSSFVSGDERALERLFLTILDNAVKYTPPGGCIKLRETTESEYAFIEIEDTGIGISEADLPHLFDRFFRADQARSREVHGTGLGLAIALWITEAHNGRIEVKSRLGEGSRFTVRLPFHSLEAVKRNPPEEVHLSPAVIS
jgi:two-component system, OmpR family, heavy metal sensor histidine kinase CusS